MNKQSKRIPLLYETLWASGLTFENIIKTQIYILFLKKTLI